MSLRIDRRSFLKAGTAALASAVLPGGGCAPEPSGPPNVLLVLTDDLNAECVGFAARARLTTPHLDALAGRGAVFDAAYCSAMPCTPSRGCILSGRNWGRWERVGSGAGARLLEGEWTWARALAEHGYDTALIGKMHLHPMRADQGFATTAYCEHRNARTVAADAPREDDYERWLAARGIVDWQNGRNVQGASFEQRSLMRRQHAAVVWPYAEEDHAISWVRDRTLDWLGADERRERPWAAVVSFRYPHSPYNPVQRFLDLQRPEQVELPGGDWDDPGSLPPVLADPIRSLARQRWSPEETRRVLAYYYALVRQIDEAVGAILAGVDLERTLVVFTSDHGDYAGWRGVLQKRPTLPFEPLARVPLLVAGVGVPEGVRIPEPVALVDLAPTFLELAGAPVPGDLDGRALQRSLAAPGAGAERSVGCVAPRGWIVVRRGPLKLFHQSDRPRDAVLIDVAADPMEIHDLARDPAHAEAREELLAAARNLVTPRPSSLSRRA